MPPWNNWYHVTLSHYGNWLPGDPRGWRVRNHKYHVEGDYHHPPEPSKFAKNLHAHAKQLLKNDPIIVEQALRRDVGERFLESLRIQQVPVHRVAAGATHVHVLIQCPKRDPKIIAGKCKQNVSRHIPCPQPSGWWAVDSHAEPINDRGHFDAASQYILEHLDEGAWVWQPEDDVNP